MRARLALLPLLLVGCEQTALPTAGAPVVPGDPPPAVPSLPALPVTGRFIAPAVEGLGFETPTQNGLTDGTGAFRYIPGERVRFFVGDVTLGEIEGQDNVHAFSIAGAVPPLTIADHLANGVEDRFTFETSRPLKQALFIATLVVTFDDDHDLDTGVRLPEALHDLMTGRNVDFDDLPYRSAFDRLIGDARETGVWTEGIPSNAPQALDIVYRGLGLRPEREVVEDAGRDTDLDGVDDVGCVTRTWSDEGHLLTEIHEDACDGMVTSSFVRSYRPDGLLDRLESFPRRVEEFIWDERGRPIGSRIDDDGDGVFETDVVRTFSIHDELLSVVVTTDGVEAGHRRITHDARGRPLRDTVDVDGDGDIDQMTIRTNDPVLNTWSIAWGGAKEGVYDWQLIGQEDDSGRLISKQSIDAQGVVNAYAYVYDDVGQLLVTETDRGNDGTLDSRWDLTFEGVGRLVVSAQRFRGTDGRDDWAHIDLWSYDDAGRVTERSATDATGVLRSRTVYSRLGDVAIAEFDHGADGEVDAIEWQRMQVRPRRWAILD